MNGCDSVKRELIPAYISGTLVNIPLFMVVVFLPPYMRKLGASNFQVGVLSTIYFLVSMPASLFWGSLSDLLENRKILPLGSIISFSFILLVLSWSVTPTQVIILRAFIGLTLPAFTAPLLALISEHSTTERRGGDISWYNAFLSLGRMIGLLITGYLALFFPFSSLFRGFGIVLLGTLLPLLFLPRSLFSVHIPQLATIVDEMKSRIFPEKEGKSVLWENGLIFLYSSITLRVICIVGFASFLPLYLTEELGYNLQFLGTFSAIGSGIMVFSMLVAGYSADVLGRKRIVLTGLLLSFLTPIFYILGKLLLLFLWLGRIFHSFGYSFLMSGSSAFVGDLARKKEQGALMGWIRLSFSFGGVIGPMIMGTILGPLGYTKAALIMSFFALCGLTLTFFKVEETIEVKDQGKFSLMKVFSETE